MRSDSAACWCVLAGCSGDVHVWSRNLKGRTSAFALVILNGSITAAACGAVNVLTPMLTGAQEGKEMPSPGILCCPAAAKGDKISTGPRQAHEEPAQIR
jgi:hypothetical protein